jgi:serine/threonine protein kinase
MVFSLFVLIGQEYLFFSQRDRDKRFFLLQSAVIQGDEILTIKQLLKEYNLEIDDVRWYLSEIMTLRLLSHKEIPLNLTKFIWSGELNDELYNMEERYLKEMQDQMDEKTLDESHVRDTLNEIETSRRKRLGY